MGGWGEGRWGLRKNFMHNAPIEPCEEKKRLFSARAPTFRLY